MKTILVTVPRFSHPRIFTRISTALPQHTIIPFTAAVLTLPLLKALSSLAPHWSSLPVHSQAVFLFSLLVLDQRVRHVWVSPSWQVYLGSVYSPGSSHFPSSLLRLQLLCILPWHHTHSEICYRWGRLELVHRVKPPQGCVDSVCPETQHF